jgi:hypothetical protein
MTENDLMFNFLNSVSKKLGPEAAKDLAKDAQLSALRELLANDLEVSEDRIDEVIQKHLVKVKSAIDEAEGSDPIPTSPLQPSDPSNSTVQI